MKFPEMKSACLVLLLAVNFLTDFGAEAQRRSGPNENETPKSVTGRGRTRFTLDQTLLDDQSHQEPARRASPRRKSSGNAIPPRKNYEVEEILDDVPVESYRRPGGPPRVFTETKFEAANAPPTSLFQPSTTESLDEIIRSIGSDLLEGSTTPQNVLPVQSTSDVTSEASVQSSTQAAKVEIEPTTARNSRKSNFRTKKIEEVTTRRTRTRVRTSGRTEDVSTTTSKPSRSSRRREPAEETRPKNRNAATLSPAESRIEETPTPKARTESGRLNRPESVRAQSSEPIRKSTPIESPRTPRTSEIEGSRTTNSEGRSRQIQKTRGEATGSRPRDIPNQTDKLRDPEPAPRTRSSGARAPPTASNLEAGVESQTVGRSRTGRRIGSTRKETTSEADRVALDLPRSRSSSRSRASKDITTTARTRSRSRLPPVIDEKKLEVLPLFEDEPKIVRPNFRKFARPNSAEEPVASSTENQLKQVKYTPRIKESVIVSEVTEVTSKKTVTKRKYKPNKSVAAKSSEEDVDESDNYPEHFKALLKKKNSNNNESRSQHRTEKVVTARTTPAPPSSSLPPKDENENEVEPSKPTTSATTRPTRKRFTPQHRVKTTSTTTEKIRTTAEHKYHAKFHPKSHNEHETTSQKPLHFSPKPPRGLYSSRKVKEVPILKSESNKISTTVPKKVNRYSSRYRYNVNSKGSTSAPAYIPTVPAVPQNSVTRDKDLGVEVLTIDDPVVTLPSANLVNGDYLSSTVTPLVSESQVVRTTEKPVSIIERIINSISAISTEEPISSTTSPVTSTKKTAILKLANSKRPTTSNILTSVPVTTEKPTTIIERILSSLTAINSTEQVGNLNSITLIQSTTPMSKVIRSTTLPAQFTTTTTTTTSTVDVLNDISNEQTLRKRTIGRLLDLLNGLISTTKSPEIVVTPRSPPVLYTSPNIDAPLPFSTTTVPSATTVAPTTLPPPPPTTVPATTTMESTTQATITPGESSTEFPTTFSPNIVPLSFAFESTTSTTPADDETETVFSFPSTVSSLSNFEVSPGSVAIFSANDISNLITPDDILSAVTIAGRTNFPETIATTVETTTSDPITTVVPLNFSSNVSNQTKDIASNVIDTTAGVSAANETVSNGTDSSTNSTTQSPNRTGRILDVVMEPVSNSLDNNSTQDPDYYIFAVLNNNTILRKRPSRYPKNTPFLILGLYPNNTIVRKFPNGTVVPMEPVIRVRGFDTRINPPPLPEITSNQVTPDQSRRTDNQTVEQNTIPTMDVNPLSISSTTSTSSSTSTTTVPSTTTAVTLPTLAEILNGKTVQAFNNIINISDLGKTTPRPFTTNDQDKTIDITPSSLGTKARSAPITTTMATTLPPATLSNRILSDSMTISTLPPAVTTDRQEISNTIAPSTTVPNTTPKITTALPLTQPSTTNLPTTTYFPSFITTLFSTLQPRRFTTTPVPIITVTPEPTTTLPPPTTTPPSTTTIAPTTTTTTAAPTTTTTATTTTISTTKTVKTTTPTTRTSLLPLLFRTLGGDLIGAGSTVRPVTTAAPRTTAGTTTTRATTTTTTSKPASYPNPTVKTARQLTDQQKKDLETLAQLENEQAQILKQLAFLTNLNVANTKPSTTDKNSLANRIIAMAVERDKQKNKSGTERQPKQVTENPLQYEELIKKINVTPSTLTTQYGSSNDALIAALLKEQGIGPKIPKNLGEIYTKTTTTKRPKTTTPPPGPLMRSLNWLLNALAPPPTTKRPKSKPKPKPKPKDDEEILSNQPTHITPLVTAAPPRQNLADSMTQEDIQKLIKQLEGVQKDPQRAKALDLSSIKSLQTLINSDESEAKPRPVKSTTALPVVTITSNSIVEEVTTPSRPRVTLPPVKLRPVPGVEDGDTRVRGQLITAAVNVTRAISSFLGSALQGAASRFTSFVDNGGRAIGTLVRGSSSNASDDN